VARSNLFKPQRIDESLQVGLSNIQPSSVVCDLGVFLDSELIMPLQRVHNADARLVFSLGRFDHVTPNPIQLLWLPVNHLQSQVQTLLSNPRHLLWS